MIIVNNKGKLVNLTHLVGTLLHMRTQADILSSLLKMTAATATEDNNAMRERDTPNP